MNNILPIITMSLSIPGAIYPVITPQVPSNVISIAVSNETSNAKHVKIFGKNDSTDYIHKIQDIENENTITKINYSKGDYKMENLRYDKLVVGDKTLYFKNGLIMSLTFNDGLLIAEYPDLELYCCGETIEELDAAIKDDLRFTWINYVDCSINELSKDAVVLRNKFMQLID